MAEKPLRAWRIATFITLFLGVTSVQACEESRRADRTVYVCFDRAGGAKQALGLLREISKRFEYRFREYGEEVKRDLEVIDADPEVAGIPDSKPIQADIENEDGKVVLIASNFGSIGEDLRVSLFYRRNEGERAPFPRAVMTGLGSIEGAQLNFSGADTDAHPCGEN
jgi:hypothetical protein